MGQMAAVVCLVFCTISKIFVISEENWQLFPCRYWSLFFFSIHTAWGFFVSTFQHLNMTCVFSNEIHCLNMIALPTQGFGFRYTHDVCQISIQTLKFQSECVCQYVHISLTQA